MTLTVSLNTTQLYFQLYFAKVADMLGWLSRTVYKICYNKDCKLLAADLKTKMDIWEFAGEWRRENKTHVHVTHNKHTLIWSHTDTHTPLSSLRTTWVHLNASDQHTLRPASSCHWSGPSRVLLLLVFLPVQVSGGLNVCLNCWNSAEIPAAAAGWRLITCCDWCHLKHYLVVRLATPLLHCCIQGLWERQRRRYFMIPPGGGWGRQAEVRIWISNTRKQSMRWRHRYPGRTRPIQFSCVYLICTFTGNTVFWYCSIAFTWVKMSEQEVYEYFWSITSLLFFNSVMISYS